MASNFSITVDLGALLEFGPMVRSGIFQNLSTAVERVTMTGADRWREAVLRAPLWEGERKAYAASISWRMTGNYSGEITSDYKFVEDIETGRPAYDMKKMLDTSMKVRVSKKGRRYLIIPMRHNTPGNSAMAMPMPAHIHAAASQLSPSRIVGQGRRESGTGAYHIKSRTPYLVRQNKYQWGGRLPAGMAPKLKPHHKADIYAGMYKFDTASPGGASYNSYMTFRVMAEGQAGWVLPAKPGLFIAKNVYQGLAPVAEKLFAEAIKVDLGA